MYDPKALERALRDIERKLEGQNLSEVSRETGIGYLTILRFAHGRAKNPYPETVSILQDYLGKEATV